MMPPMMLRRAPGEAHQPLLQTEAKKSESGSKGTPRTRVRPGRFNVALDLLFASLT
jgi:hypothetical protein